MLRPCAAEPGGGGALGAGARRRDAASGELRLGWGARVPVVVNSLEGLEESAVAAEVEQLEREALQEPPVNTTAL